MTNSSSLPKAKLSDLPFELLLHIFQDVDRDDLYSLCFLCRSLHYSAQTVYFSHIFASSSLVSDGVLRIHPYRAPLAYDFQDFYGLLPLLRAVGSSLFITSLSLLTWKFASPSFVLRTHFSYINRLLDSLERVERVVLDFDGVSLEVPVITGIDWRVSLLGLVKKLREMGCTSLTALGARNLVPPSFPSRRRQPSGWQRLKLKVGIGSAKHDSADEDGYVTPTIEVTKRGIEILQGLWLTSLTLSSGFFVDHSGIERLAPITIPSLRSFTYMGYHMRRVPFQSFAAFLSKHPSIEALHLSCVEGPVNSVMTLPKLRSLSANPDFIACIQTSAYPQLAEICLLVEFGFRPSRPTLGFREQRAAAVPSEDSCALLPQLVNAISTPSLRVSSTVLMRIEPDKREDIMFFSQTCQYLDKLTLHQAKWQSKETQYIADLLSQWFPPSTTLKISEVEVNLLSKPVSQEERGLVSSAVKQRFPGAAVTVLSDPPSMYVLGVHGQHHRLYGQ